MKTIKLLNLKLTNFKGIKSFELNANGEDMKVFGENATGKTTIFDAFVWLLFGKDSQNSTQFEIKTLRDGKPIHKLNHEVEATLLVDGQELTLKKVYKEKWTKKRGSVTESFSGHTTDYYIDGVP
ncbi:MAG TPA: ATP-binding protein, partial [Massilibacterium sp.]|nr:ATP-binding protein [Massilibacterium sp.]